MQVIVANEHNIISQAIWDTLVHLVANGRKLPPVLNLQLDNTTKSCKGKFLFSWLGLLVHAGIFKKVIVSFLPVGHTHEDIDQFFSCISRALRRRPAHSRIMLAQVIKDSYKSSGVSPVVRHWENVANISGWLAARARQLTDITAYQQFRIFLAATDGEVWLQGRVWPGASEMDDSYGGLSGNDTHAQLFKDNVYPNLHDEFDEVPPAQSTAKPPCAETLKKVRSGLDEMFTHMKVEQRDIDDCNHLFAVYSTPPENIPFAWSRLDVAAFFGGGDEPARVEQQRPRLVEHVNASGEHLVLDDFQLTMPAAADICPRTHPFGICRIKHILRNAQAEPIVHIQEWILEAGQDPIKGKYKVHASQENGQRKNKYPVRKMDEGFQATVRMTVKGRYAHLNPASRQGQSLAKYWAGRFAGGEDMKMEPSEQMNQSGFEEVENPRPKVRKKPKNRPKDADDGTTSSQQCRYVVHKFDTFFIHGPQITY
jgi:hypothetical protein